MTKARKKQKSQNGTEDPKLDLSSNISEIDILTEVGSIGAGNASIALSRMINEPIKIEVPRIHFVSPHVIPRIYNKHDTNVIATFMQLRGKADCDIMLIFEEKEAEKIASLMAKGALINSKAMRNSALEELGSIMIGSFLSAIANFTGLELIPTPPQVIFDDFDASIDELIAKQALCSDVAAVFDSRFRRENSSAEGLLMIFLSRTIRRKLAEKSKIWLEV